MSCQAKSRSSPGDFCVPAPPAEEVPVRLARIHARAHCALLRRQTRKALLELDDRLLDDIGVTREQARTEARKPMWR